MLICTAKFLIIFVELSVVALTDFILGHRMLLKKSLVRIVRYLWWPNMHSLLLHIPFILFIEFKLRWKIFVSSSDVTFQQSRAVLVKKCSHASAFLSGVHLSKKKLHMLLLLQYMKLHTIQQYKVSSIKICFECALRQKCFISILPNTSFKYQFTHKEDETNHDIQLSAISKDTRMLSHIIWFCI